MTIRAGIAGALLLLVLGAGAAPGQEQYPSRVVRIIVPTSPGFVTDVIARALAQALSQSWGQQVIVENRAGAEIVGVGTAAKSPPDGYTLVVTSNSAVTAAPHMYSQLAYDPLKELTPIHHLGQVTPVMVVPAASPVNSVQDLIALAKSKPGQLNYGSFGVGTYSHVAMEDFKQRTGIDMQHIPYKGAAPAYTGLLRSDTAVMFANLAGAIGHEEAGKVKIIAAAGPQRAKLRPNLPTVAESGVPGFATGAWWGLFGPANLPKPILDKIRADVAGNIATPNLQKVFAANTMELVELTPAQLAQFIRDDLDYWGRAIKAAGVKPN